VKIVLAEREAQLMQVLWEHGPSTVAEAQAHLKDDLAYTTVLTDLQKLEKKGCVRHEEEGRAHRFKASIDRERAQRIAVRDLAARLFKGSAALLLTQAISDENMSEEDLNRIRRLIDARQRRDKT
jgi:BlaI family transcriptional regulator, penicillinase repressor